MLNTEKVRNLKNRDRTVLTGPSNSVPNSVMLLLHIKNVVWKNWCTRSERCDLFDTCTHTHALMHATHRWIFSGRSSEPHSRSVVCACQTSLNSPCCLIHCQFACGSVYMEHSCNAATLCCSTFLELWKQFTKTRMPPEYILCRWRYCWCLPGCRVHKLTSIIVIAVETSSWSFIQVFGMIIRKEHHI